MSTDADSPSAEYAVVGPASFGTAILEFRTRMGLTQQELAERADIHRSYLSTLERGKSTEAMRQIFDALRTLGLEVVIRPR